MRLGNKMKIIVLLVLFCMLSTAATAQTAGCQSIPKADARLACYDKASPPVAPPDKSALSKVPAPPQGPPVDRLSQENARLDAKINNICRGC
jgi:hypothetical protein